MAIDSRPLSERGLIDLESDRDSLFATNHSKAALIERLPFALSYAANLEPHDRAVLFCDGLVAAAEYFCAYIEEGIRRRETTFITGLSPERYRSLFEQVGIRVAELENCGYLLNLSTADFCKMERLNKNGIGRNSEIHVHREPHHSINGIRFIHVQGEPGRSIEDLREAERGVHVLSASPATSICCYDVKTVLEEAPSDCFARLLRSHNHCFFQGLAMPTCRLLDLHGNAVYPNLRST